MENKNELIDQLIANQSLAKNDANILQDTEGQVLITTARVVSIRYKIYVLVLLIILGFFGYDYLLPAYDEYIITKNQLTSINNEIKNFPSKKMKYEADRKLIAMIHQQQDQIISCLNYHIGCNQLDKSIQDNFGVARSYIQLNSLSSPKMLVDEKKILANINEFLIKRISNDPQNVSRIKNGNINTISIGEPASGPGILGSVPIKLNITFSDKESLLSFIDNIEKNVSPDPNYRILYKLDEVSYDIVKYTMEQQVDILMHAYFINS